MTGRTVPGTLRTMVNAPHPAQELALLDKELARLDAHRGRLTQRRAYLVDLLARTAADTARVPRPGAPHSPTPVRPRPSPASPPVSAPSPTSAPPSAQNVLLTLGGLLLTIAAVAFTLVSWGHLGIGGRSAVLMVVTGAALAVPALLLRRRLTATAEAVAALGLMLTVLDTYALYRVAWEGADPVGYSAGAAAVLAAGWTAYGSALGRLRLPLPAGVLTAQLPLLLWALTADASELTVLAALLATGALDTAAALWTRPPVVRVVTGAAAAATVGSAALDALVLSGTADTPLGAAGPGALLLGVAALGLAATRHPRARGLALTAGVVAGLAGIGAVGGVLHTVVPAMWAVPGYLLCALALSAVVLPDLLSPAAAPRGTRPGLPAPVARGLARAACSVALASVAWTVPSVAVVLFGALARASGAWAGAPDSAREAFGVAPLWWNQGTVPLVLLVGCAALTVARRRASHHPRVRAEWLDAGLAGVVVLAWAAVAVLPLALGLPYAAALALPLVLTAAALALAVRPDERVGVLTAVTALGCAFAGLVAASSLAAASRPATVITLAVLSALFAAAAVAAERVRARMAGTPAGGAPRAVQAVLGVVAVGLATALVLTASSAADVPTAWSGVLVLTVPAAVALAGARLRLHPVAVPIELTAMPAGLIGVALTVGRLPVLALALALCGVIAAGTAVREERRPWAGYAAGVFFVLAAWVRLGASGVSTPEAYTLPVTLPALAVGLLRRREDPEASSWTAYGPGLAATLLPSLVAAWGDAHWLRPLLLGLAALGLTLAGARLRLQAVLLLGGAVLALDALHELAPYVVQVVGVLPRWLPPALAGLLLLAVGATYEQRLRDARRLRAVLGRMR